MQFEKIFINNDNGKINGYHQKGKYENGKFELYLNKKLGNDEVSDNLLSYKLESDKMNSVCDNKCDKSGACDNAHKSKDLNDFEFIKLCENKLQRDELLSKALKLRSRLRALLEREIVPCVLEDFKTLVRVMETEDRNPKTEKVVYGLIQKYSHI